MIVSRKNMETVFLKDSPNSKICKIKISWLKKNVDIGLWTPKLLCFKSQKVHFFCINIVSYPAYIMRPLL